MMGEVVGRERVLDSVYAFLDRSVEGLAGLVLEGDPGIGKSTLWRAAVAAARERGLLVLSAQPSEAERELAYVGLGDLFEDALDDVLPALSAPRRRALEVALLREAGEAGDPRTLGVAVRDALRLLGGTGQLVVAIDDVQWLDDASARALGFALRRLSDENMAVLLARRAGTPGPTSEVEQAVDAERTERLVVTPLSVGAIQQLLRARLGRPFRRPTLLRLHGVSGGNPFFALELARALGANERAIDPVEPLPVPESLERLVQDRLGDLTETTREALSLVAAAGRSSPAMLDAAGVSQDALAPAFAARVIELVDGIIRFTHPLLASALYQELPAEARSRAHRLLAEVVDDPLVRARHLALASQEPNEDIAAELQQAVAIAAGRGATANAAELAEHALRLTPAGAGEDRHRRAIAAARMQLLAGDGRRALTHASRLLKKARTGDERAEALVLLSDVVQSGDLQRSIALRHEALAEPDLDPALQASIHQWLGSFGRTTEGLRAAERHVQAALELAGRVGDDALRVAALATLGVLRFNFGEPDALALVEQADVLAAAADDSRTRLESTVALGHVLTWSGDLDRARTLLEGLYQELSERDERASGSTLWYLSLVELGAGRLSVAADHADRQRDIGRVYAVDEHEDPLAIWVVARVAVHRGELDRARELAERSRVLAQRQPSIAAGQEAVLGLVEAWSGRRREAVARFEAAERGRSGGDVRDPGLYWWRAEYAEALLEVGRIDAAVDLLDRWEADAARLGRDRVLADVARCRGLVAAAGGDIEEALPLLEHAVGRHEAAGDPFGRGRALLALGIARRRARQKRGAREAIEAALQAFEAIGADGWAATARGELGRIGGRTREEGLTTAERRVAALVAEGRTNREVAAALFLGERTVETHLSHVYAKLGLRSRAELARVYRPDSEGSGKSSGGSAISS
jgi:DNA-binding CsgD family transcriptional regulator